MTTRVLCLGNSLLADDALGPEVANRLRERPLGDTEIVESAETGFYLLDHVLGCARLLVVDTIRTGTMPPGTILRLQEQDIQATPGSSPHYVGLFETLSVARQLGLPAPAEVLILAVEAEDLTSIGHPMTPAVERAASEVLQQIEAELQSGKTTVTGVGPL